MKFTRQFVLWSSVRRLREIMEGSCLLNVCFRILFATVFWLLVHLQLAGSLQSHCSFVSWGFAVCGVISVRSSASPVCRLCGLSSFVRTFACIHGNASSSVCCFNSIDMENMLILCMSEGECACITTKDCCAPGQAKFPVGMLSKEEMTQAIGEKGICVLSLFCCQRGLKKPEVCVKSMGQQLCIKTAGSFPFDDAYVSKLICALCFFQFAPNKGFLKSSEGVCKRSWKDACNYTSVPPTEIPSIEEMTR